MTFRAGSRFDFLVLILEERPEDEAAFGAVVFDHGELRHDAGSARDHAGSANQLVQMQLTQGSDICNGFEAELLRLLMFKNVR